MSEETQDFRWIGKRVARPDAPDKACGVTKYMTDLQFPNAVYGRALRSKSPHARILRVDTSKARALPGVICVLTADDVPGLNAFGILMQDQPVLAWEKVRMTGDAVALVAAETEELAELALDLIAVEYEPLPVVSDPIQGMAPDAPLVHASGNICHTAALRHGDVAAAFTGAAVVVSGTFQTPRQMHAFIETEGGWAQVDAAGTLTIWCPGQAAFRDRVQIARILKWKPNRIRIVSNPLGGAFGGKDELTVQQYLALLALHTGGRPVKLHYKREESVIAGVKRHPFRIEAQMGVAADGSITALQATLIADKGAYASLGPAVLDLAVEHMAGPYRVANVDVKGFLVYTNNGTNGAFRGFGVPQVCFALESLVDMAADRLGIDRIAIRKQNVARRGEIGAAGHPVEGSVAVWECLEALEHSDLWGDRDRLIAAATVGTHRGVGVACSLQGVGMGKGIPDFANAAIELTADGTFCLLVAPQEIGQGNSLTYILMVAEILDCDVREIAIAQGDTACVPDGGTVTASRGTYAGGMASIAAARNMRTLLLQGGAALLEVATNSVTLKDGRVVSGEGSVCFREVFDRMASTGRNLRAEGYFSLPQSAYEVEGIHGAGHYVFGYAAQACLVEVDDLTGETRVLKVVSAIDCGRVINPIGLEGQSEGGVVMGLGFALSEETLMESGVHRTRNITTYILPTIHEAPEIETITVESQEETGPFGAKGIGEVVMVPIVAAIPNAICHATGARVYQLPATPERVWRAMRDREPEKGCEA